MNWDAIGAIAELLGAIGVIASLIYLARQIPGLPLHSSSPWSGVIDLIDRVS
jgi:hypothetical protein